MYLVPFKVILDTPEMTIEVVDEVITIKTPEDILTCTPSEVLDSPRNITYSEFEKVLEAKGDNVANVIKNWYQRGL